VQKNRVKTLYRHGKPLEEELALSDPLLLLFIYLFISLIKIEVQIKHVHKTTARLDSQH